MQFRPLLVLIVSLAVAGAAYRCLGELVYRSDRKKIESIVRSDERFKNITLARYNGGVSLNGRVKTKEDFNLLLKEVGAIHRGRVTPKIAIEEQSVPR
jgi:hypothetical protein